MILQLYPVSVEQYSDEAAATFASGVLPHLRAWSRTRAEKPETQNLGVEELVIEWRGAEHKVHAVRYL